jgi:hypothetical protein
VDDHNYLLRLLSLIFDTSEGGTRLRFASDAQAQRWFDESQKAFED